MSIYSGPHKESGGERFKAKFVRVKDTLITSEPSDDTMHDTLAREHGIYEYLEEVRVEEPDELDGGSYLVEGSTIEIVDFSSSLDLPVTPGARKETVELFRERSKGFEVIMNPKVPYEILASISEARSQE